jgi:phosphonate transport system permease protein
MTARRWSPLPFIGNVALRWSLLAAAAAYLIVGINSVEVNWQRVVAGADRGAAFLAGFLAPDFITRGREIFDGLLESLAITVVSTVLGVMLSVPIGLGAARNLAPGPIYVACRSVIAVSRALQEIIVAILFVVMFGFGPLAGVLTLAFATIGFLAKLLAEDIEEIDPAPTEAIRATGASWWQWIVYAVQPQVMARFVGLSLYRLDINFRESAVIGIVGAGGIGATLNTAFDRYDYNTGAAILLVIIAIVLAVEYSSAALRRRVQ